MWNLEISVYFRKILWNQFRIETQIWIEVVNSSLTIYIYHNLIKQVNCNNDFFHILEQHYRIYVFLIGWNNNKSSSLISDSTQQQIQFCCSQLINSRSNHSNLIKINNNSFIPCYSFNAECVSVNKYICHLFD